MVISSFNAVQDIVRSILNSFYTTAETNSIDRVGYPYATLVNKDIKKRIIHTKKQLMIISQNSDEQLLRKIISIEKNTLLSSHDISQFLSVYYCFLSKYEPLLRKGKRKITIKIPAINLRHYVQEGREYVAVLSKLQEYGYQLNKAAYGTLFLFGSFATIDYVRGYSDLDVCFVISKHTCHDKKKLHGLRKEIAKIMRESFFVDPFQHHGPYMFTEYDLASFPQHYLPFAVFRNAVSLGGHKRLTFYERDSRNESLQLLSQYHNLLTTIYRTRPQKLFSTNYSSKYLNQVILLFPSVYLLAKGHPCYKRESFRHIKKYLHNEGNRLLDTLTNIRQRSMHTKPLGVSAQKFFRIIPSPFVYPFLYRITHRTPIHDEEQKRLRLALYPGIKNMIYAIKQLGHE